jgi:zinc carboxypeptidase/type IX secretion system substrate protein
MRLRGTGNPLKALIAVLLIFLASSLGGQWEEVQLNDGDMAADLAEALTFTKYPTYPQYLEILLHFAESYPEICRVDTFGTSVEGRLLLAVKISDHVHQNEDEASFLYTSSMHGDELVGYPMMLRLISYLLSGYGEDTEVDLLVNNLEIWINPLANPDGTYYPDNDLSVAASVRETSDGTDMNREFPDILAGGAVNDTSGRARETRAMMAFLQERRFTMSANIHSGEEVVNYPWDHTYSLHADDDWFRFISREYADEARAVDPDYMSQFTDGITNGAQWYPISGGRQDYVTYLLEGREVTLELCSEKRLASSLLDEYWQKNERSLLNYMAQCMYGIRGRVNDSETELPVEARVEIPGYDHYHSAIHSRATHGDFYRLIDEGTYNLVVSAPGYFSDTIPTVIVDNYQATEVSVSLEPYASSTESEEAFTFSLWPNPASDHCMIYPGIQNGDQLNLIVFRSNGVMMLEKNLSYYGGGIKIITSQWETGLYLIRCSTDRAFSTKRLIVF